MLGLNRVVTKLLYIENIEYLKFFSFRFILVPLGVLPAGTLLRCGSARAMWLPVCNPVSCLFCANRGITQVELVRDPQAGPSDHVEAALSKSLGRPSAHLPPAWPPSVVRLQVRPLSCGPARALSLLQLFRLWPDDIFHPLLNFKLGLTRLAENEDE